MALVWVDTSLVGNTITFLSYYVFAQYQNAIFTILICAFFLPFQHNCTIYNHSLAPVSALYRPTDLSSCWGGSSSVLMTTQSWPRQRKQMEPQGDVSIQLTTWVSQGGMNRCSSKDGKGVRCRSRLPYAKVRVR